MFFNRGIGPTSFGRGMLPSLFGRGMGSSLYPLAGALAKPKWNWTSLLTNAEKTVGLINQSIPIFYQFGPIAKNAKTMFRVISEFNKSDKPNNTTPALTNNSENSKNIVIDSTDNSTNTTNNSNNPRFFI
jgi:hypothetical protein